MHIVAGGNFRLTRKKTMSPLNVESKSFRLVTALCPYVSQHVCVTDVFKCSDCVLREADEERKRESARARARERPISARADEEGIG